MRKFATILMLISALLVGGIALEAKTTKKTKSTTARTAKKKRSGGDAEVTAIVKKLWKGIPDHGMNKYTQSCLTPDFYNLVDVGFAIPSNDPGGIGSEEIMYYWYNGQDWIESKSRVISTSPISKTPDKIVTKVRYTDGFEPSEHEIVLVKLPGSDKWLIDDFDGLRNSIYEYVSDIGVKFMNGYANEILSDPEIGGYMDASEKREYLKDVENFKTKFRKVYPDGVVKK